MKCPTCGSTSLHKNGRPKGRQRYRCKDCGRHFITQSPASLVSPNQSEVITLIQAPGIAILLLDAENLKINNSTEQFLGSISEHPLQVKIAFGNWKNSSLNKYDVELFERGYQLIHVPEGKNSADAQMMTMGAAISRQYSDAQAVFVCSSDWLLTHLCNSLQNQGLTVYRVRRQADNILNIENRNTLEVRHYSLEMETEIPPLEEFVTQIQNLLQVESESVSQRSFQLSIIESLFQKRCEISVDQKSYPNSSHNQKKLSQVISQESALEVQKNIATDISTKNSGQPVGAEKVMQSNIVSVPLISSQLELEEKLIQIISDLMVDTNHDFIPIQLINQKIAQIFGSDFQNILKSLNISSSLENFFQVSQKFRVKKNQKTNDYRVAIALNIPVIMSAQQLEEALVKIVKMLTSNAPGSYIRISNIGSEFQKKYGNSINQTMKQLRLSSKFLDFLQSCNSFHLKKAGKDYQVAVVEAGSRN